MVVIEDVAEEIQEKTEEEVEDEDEDAPDVRNSQEPVEATAAPAAPAGPEMKLSQILPMVAMLGLQKFDIEKLGYTRHVEILYVVVQVLCLGLLYFIYDRINKMSDDGLKIKMPEVKQMGQVVKPAGEQTAKEYDMAQWKEAVKQPVIGCVILGGIYYKWGSIMPLVMQVLMTPMQLYEAPLTQIHLFGKKKSRPFPTPNPFGLPSAPAEPEPEAAATSAPVEDKKKN